jgi:hypothetical protein
MHALRPLIVVAIVLIAAAPASARGWRGIEPLRSTRADVVRLLGQPAEERDGYMQYELESETVSIRLTTEGVPRSECALGVRPGTVASISVEPKGRRTLRAFGLRRSRMRRFYAAGKAFPEHVGLVDSRGGVVARIYDGEVNEIVFVAPAALRRQCRSYTEEYGDLEALVSVAVEPPVPMCVSVTVAGDVYIGDWVTVMANASDADGDVLTYKWTSTCGRIIGSGSNVTFDATGLSEGSCTVTAQISDPGGHTVECSATVNVRARPSIP